MLLSRQKKFLKSQNVKTNKCIHTWEVKKKQEKKKQTHNQLEKQSDKVKIEKINPTKIWEWSMGFQKGLVNMRRTRILLIWLRTNILTKIIYEREYINFSECKVKI